MRSLTSLLRTLVGSPAPRTRRGEVRASLAVESLEGRALPSTSPVLAVAHHGADDVQHHRAEHGPEIQVEHGLVAASGKSQAADDRGANRQNDNAHDKNDDRGAKRQAQAQKADDHGANRQNDNAHDKNDDRGGHR